MKVAILGTRGVPARYGGFETFAEQLGTRLSARGHEVTVYCRRSFFEQRPPEDFQGIRSVASPTIMHKYLETPVHALTSFLRIKKSNTDVILLCNAANSPFAWLGRIKTIPIAINVDGIERRRTKWNWVGKLWYRLGEISSLLFASKVIADAEAIAAYYRETYRHNPKVIAYGAEAVVRPAGKVLEEFHLTSRNYILYVSRLEPENNALGVIQAYNQLIQNNPNREIPLVIVGDAPYAGVYKDELKKTASAGVVFCGYQFGEAYQELQSNAAIYIQATEVGGTHPALIESMAYGNCIVANGTPENLEVLSDAGEFYSVNNFSELAQKLQNLLSDSEKIIRFRKLAKARATAVYNWDRITDQYEELLGELAKKSTA